jgi:hypothetical protein
MTTGAPAVGEILARRDAKPNQLGEGKLGATNLVMFQRRALRMLNAVPGSRPMQRGNRDEGRVRMLPRIAYKFHQT